MSKLKQLKQIVYADVSVYEDFTGWKTLVKRLLMYRSFRILFLHRVINTLEWGG